MIFCGSAIYHQATGKKLIFDDKYNSEEIYLQTEKC